MRVSELKYVQLFQAGLLPTGEMVLSISHNNNFAKAQILEKIAFSHGIQRSVKIAVQPDTPERECV